VNRQQVSFYVELPQDFQGFINKVSLLLRVRGAEIHFLPGGIFPPPYTSNREPHGRIGALTPQSPSYFSQYESHFAAMASKSNEEAPKDPAAIPPSLIAQAEAAIVGHFDDDTPIERRRSRVPQPDYSLYQTKSRGGASK
jgi:hypothetical protein